MNERFLKPSFSRILLIETNSSLGALNLRYLKQKITSQKHFEDPFN